MVKSRALVIALVAFLVLAACGDDDESDASSATTAADSAATSAAGAGTTAAAATSLAGVCPETIVVQSNWWPEPDHGLFYELIGADGTIDANAATPDPANNLDRAGARHRGEPRDPRGWSRSWVPDRERPDVPGPRHPPRHGGH